jgi:hypothetical protein
MILKKYKLSFRLTRIATGSILFVISSLFAELGPQILWSQEFGGFAFYDIVKTSNGTFTAVGDMDMPINGCNLWLMNFNDTGKILWSKNHERNGYIFAENAQVLPDNGYIAGTTLQSTLRDGFSRMLIFRLKENGDTLWTFLGRDSCNEYTHMVVSTKDNGFLIVGTSDFYSHAISNTLLVKLDEHGDTLWSRHFESGSYFNSAYRAIELSDSGFMMVGLIRTDTTAYMKAIWMLRLNSRGDTLYTRRVEENKHSVYLNALKKTPDNGFVIVGAIGNIDSSQRSSAWGYVEEDTMFILKLNFSGEKEWMKKYSDALWSSGQSIEITPDGGFIVCGTRTKGTIDSLHKNLCLVRLNAQGDVIWLQNYRDTTRNDAVGDAIIYAGGNRYIAVDPKNWTGT